jgi:hypothetical protein
LTCAGERCQLPWLSGVTQRTINDRKGHDVMPDSDKPLRGNDAWKAARAKVDKSNDAARARGAKQRAANEATRLKRQKADDARDRANLPQQPRP